MQILPIKHNCPHKFASVINEPTTIDDSYLNFVTLWIVLDFYFPDRNIQIQIVLQYNANKVTKLQ